MQTFDLFFQLEVLKTSHHSHSNLKMVVGVFPALKLGVLFIKQISKPLAQVIVNQAKNHPVFRTYFIIPPAQCTLCKILYLLDFSFFYDKIFDFSSLSLGRGESKNVSNEFRQTNKSL